GVEVPGRRAPAGPRDREPRTNVRAAHYVLPSTPLAAGADAASAKTPDGAVSKARRHQTMRALATGTAGGASPGPGSSAPAAARRRRAVGEAAMGYAFVAPAVLLFLVFQGYPILRSLT